MTNDAIRKQWRIKLHAKRLADNDQSKERYIRDAKVLNRAMDMFKIDGRKAMWG
jgi:uncharacterized protein (DUF2384 family)